MLATYSHNHLHATGPEHRMITDNPNAEASVLLVEDDEDDVYIVRRTLDGSPMEMVLEVKKNGREAVDYLEEICNSGGRLPDIVLLDLNMPIMDGHAVISHLKSHESLDTLPIVVLTTSSDQDTIQRAYGAGANAVVTKEDTLESMSEIVNTIVEFWFHTAQRPPGIPSS